MIFYHVTNGEAAARILADGFVEGEGNHMRTYRGVSISAEPLTIHEGAHGDHLLAVEIAEELVTVFEWIELEKREFLVPAVVLNAHGKVRVASVDRLQCWEVQA